MAGPVFFLLLALANPALGNRVSVSEGSHLGLAEGDVFEGFQLESHLGHSPLQEQVASFLEDHVQQNGSALTAPLVQFPKIIGKDFGAPHLLGAGSFGEAWLATGTPGTAFAGRQVVVKILYIKEGRKAFHVTRSLAQKNKILQREVGGAVRECRFAMDLQEAAPKMGEFGPLAQRLMGCYAHNYKKVTGMDVPIYLVLENCGKNDLAAYITKNQKTFTSKQMASVVRQIAEGLLYLSMQNPPMIHHDLKPKNIVVKETASGYPTVHLIDFGGMMKATTQSQHTKKTVSTGVFAPPEWQYDEAFKLPAHAFDMYAVGNILADMAFGNLFSIVHYDQKRDEPNWRGLKSVSEIASRSAFVSTYEPIAKKAGAVGLKAMEQDPNAYNFIVDYWVKMIRHEPSQRPSPDALLKSSWLADAPAPTNPNWQMYVKPQEVKVEEGAAEEEAVATPEAATEAGCIKFCDTCDTGGKKESTKLRQTMYCGIESENLKQYDPDNNFLRLGPAPEFCDKSARMETIGRNLHGRDGPQTYYIWKCGKVTAEEAKNWVPKSKKQ